MDKTPETNEVETKQVTIRKPYSTEFETVNIPAYIDTNDKDAVCAFLNSAVFSTRKPYES